MKKESKLCNKLSEKEIDIDKAIWSCFQQDNECGFYFDSETKKLLSPVVTGNCGYVILELDEKEQNRKRSSFHTHLEIQNTLHQICYPSFTDLSNAKNENLDQLIIGCKPNHQTYTYQFNDIQSDLDSIYDEMLDLTEELQYEKNDTQVKELSKKTHRVYLTIKDIL